MRVRRHPDAGSLLGEAGTFLAEREALNSLPLSIARQCRSDPSRYPGPNYFAVVREDDGRTVGVALRTAPYRLALYVPPGPAVDAVAADLARSPEHTPPGVHGPRATADAFAAAWCGPRGQRPVIDKDLRAFELTRIQPAPATRGRMRRAVASDLALAEAWYRAFDDEAHAAKGALSSEEIGRRAVREERLYLWEDEVPVAQAAVVGVTARGARVGAVYTPPDRRRRGYATALVAALSQQLLDDGRSSCFLFTDLSNPTSNSIYPKVGYRAVGDFRDVDFRPAAEDVGVRLSFGATGPGQAATRT